MEAQALAVHRSSVAASRLGSRSGNSVGAQSSRDPSLVPASLGKQQLWRFRVERKVTLLPARRQGNAARAKKSDTGFKFPGSLKVKESAESVGKDGKAAAEKGAEKLGGFSGSIKASATEKVPSPVKRTVTRKDKNVVFVAGATGKVGRRVVRELVQLGYSVKAGTRNPEKSQSLLEFAGSSKPQSDATGEAEATEAEPKKKPSLWANIGLDNIFGFLKAPKKTPGVELVEVNLEKPDEIEDAIGEASVVVCAIGASEKEALNVTGPYRIDYKATENLIKAATSAKVNHFVLVTSLGTTGIGWPATALNLFWGVLVWKAKAEKALIESGIPFTIVRPGGMERPTDTYKETHNLLLDKANSRFGGQVSHLQVAELIASAVGNSKLAEYKILEAVAETTAPLRPIEELLAEIPTVYDSESLKVADKEEQAAKKQADEEEKQGKRAEIQAAKKLVEEEKARKKEEQRLAKQREEEERVAEQAKLQAVREKLQNEYAAAKEREEEARIAAEEALSEKEEIEKRVADLRAKIDAAAQAAREAKAVETAVTAAAREGNTLSEGEKRSVVAAERAKIDAEAKQKAAQEKDRRAAEAKAAAEKEKKEKDAEAAKVKAEEKRKTEAAKAEADKKAKAEAKEREQAEAKKKAEEDKKAKAEAEVKAQAEAEKKAKAEAEKKAKAEAEAKTKAETEKKAKVEEEKKPKAETPKAAKEVVSAAKEAVPAAKEAVPAAKEAVPAAKKAVPAAKKAVEVVASGKLIKDGEPPDEEIAKKAAQATKEAKAREQEALELAKAAAVFVWPWEKAKRTNGRPAAPDKAPDKAPSAKGKDSLPYSATPLSPYAQYPDLKPPTSPRPSPPTPVADEGATKKVDSPPAKEVSSSNGPVDIKPKTSPAPSTDDSKGSEVDVGVGEVATLATDKAAETAAVATDKAAETAAAVTDKAAEIAALATEKTAEVAAREKEALELAKAATTGTFAWPWQKTSEESSPKPAQKSSSTDLPRTSRPLSPYWMYPDLKPPTSPRPSANKRKL